MNIEPSGDGKAHFRLGPVERWIVAGVAAAVVGGCSLFANSVLNRLDQLSVIDTRTQVMQQQVQTLTTQLADVPSLKTDIAELKVRINNHDEQLKELRSIK